MFCLDEGYVAKIHDCDRRQSRHKGVETSIQNVSEYNAWYPGRLLMVFVLLTHVEAEGRAGLGSLMFKATSHSNLTNRDCMHVLA